MKLAPKREDFARIRKALKFYEVTSVITGVMLLLLTVEMVLKYGFGYELFAGTSQGALSLVALDEFGEAQSDGFNLSTGILIAHGWFYVIYLFSNYLLWSPMRWSFFRFLVLASGGIIPFWSFILEKRIAREVNELLDSQQDIQAPLGAASQSAEVHH